MKISIITICFNSSNTIEETIKSVINQNYNNIEYIIIDGKSSDETLSIVNKYKPKISKIISEKDNGIYDAMNKGIAQATGDVIGILNSDDVYSNNFIISDIATIFNTNQNLDLLYGNIQYVKKNNTNLIVREWISKMYTKNFFEYGNVPPHPALFVKAYVYKTSGNFDLQFKLAADYDFMLRIFKNYSYNTMYVNKLIVKMRLGGATNNSFKNIFKGNIEIFKSWKKYKLTPPFYFFPIRIIKRILQFV